MNNWFNQEKSNSHAKQPRSTQRVEGSTQSVEGSTRSVEGYGRAVSMFGADRRPSRPIFGTGQNSDSDEDSLEGAIGAGEGGRQLFDSPRRGVRLVAPPTPPTRAQIWNALHTPPRTQVDERPPMNRIRTPPTPESPFRQMPFPNNAPPSPLREWRMPIHAPPRIPPPVIRLRRHDANNMFRMFPIHSEPDEEPDPDDTDEESEDEEDERRPPFRQLFRPVRRHEEEEESDESSDEDDDMDELERPVRPMRQPRYEFGAYYR